MITKLHIQFQGGFAGKDCNLEMKNAENDEIVKCEFYPEDINQMQVSFLKQFSCNVVSI